MELLWSLITDIIFGWLARRITLSLERKSSSVLEQPPKFAIFSVSCYDKKELFLFGVMG
ncbi:hypothetical protein [Peribacillus deserti]|uniref:hypothetical protein n=1 Tax=Peribacillus deserti TaxID=673318 RepID=UPI0015E0B59B|nr:hypothetical protein [Peribacillus deserti]